ncbi:hypothetical protein D3C80_427590 [compost metagenome]
MVDLTDHGVEGGGLAAASRAGNQDHPVRFVRQAAQAAQGVIFEPQGLQLHAADAIGQVLLVEYPQHRIFTEDARHDRHTKVDLPGTDADLEATVLRYALFTDVQLGHDLDPRDHLFGELAAADLADAVEHAIDAVLDHQTVTRDTQMNVTGVHFQGVIKGRVDQLDHPALVFADAGQRQALQGVEFVDCFAFVVQRVNRMKAFFVAGQKAGKVSGFDQVQRRALQALVDPG